LFLLQPIALISLLFKSGGAGGSGGTGGSGGGDTPYRETGEPKPNQ